MSRRSSRVIIRAAHRYSELTNSPQIRNQIFSEAAFGQVIVESLEFIDIHAFNEMIALKLSGTNCTDELLVIKQLCTVQLLGYHDWLKNRLSKMEDLVSL